MEGASELSRAEAGDRREPLDSLMIDRPLFRKLMRFAVSMLEPTPNRTMTLAQAAMNNAHVQGRRSPMTAVQSRLLW
jgi:hypothetical protein